MVLVCWEKFASSRSLHTQLPWQGGWHLSPAHLHGPFIHLHCSQSLVSRHHIQPAPLLLQAFDGTSLPSPLLSALLLPPIGALARHCDVRFPSCTSAFLAGPPAQRPLGPALSHHLLKSYSYLKTCSLPPSWTELGPRVGQACVRITASTTYLLPDLGQVTIPLRTSLSFPI